MRARTVLLGLVLVSAALPASASAVAPEITLLGSSSARAGEPSTFHGRVHLLDLVGLPLRDVRIFRDGDLATTTQTDRDGRYSLELTFDQIGMFTLVAVTDAGQPTEAESDPFTVTVRGEIAITVGLLSASATRNLDRVHVRIDAGGLVEHEGEPESGWSVSGETSVVNGTPCWGEQAPCVEVIDEQVEVWRATTGDDGRYRFDAGPFTYSLPYGGSGPPACDTLAVTIHVAADSGTHATWSGDVTLCA